MTSEGKKQLLAEQVRALATIVLTRRGDLAIVDSKKDTGLDLHVYIDREDKPMRLMFGILLRGVPSAVSLANANKILEPTMGQFRGMRKFTYPVCLFLFTLKDERALFSWLAEPVITGTVPKLVHHEKAHCVPLTDEALSQIVEQIVAWYDAIEAVLIA